MSLVLNKKKAIFWGEFIEVASAMDAAGVINPPQPSYFPKDWRLVKNISMEVEVGIFRKAEFIGIVAQSKVDPDKFAIALHGNTGILDFVEELGFHKTDFYFIPDGGETEYGFTKLYESLSFMDPSSGRSENLEDYLRGLDPASSFTVAGHSVGGALGIMHALVLSYLQFPVEAYIFGAPMVGDADFVKRYHSLVPKSYLIVNQPDVVPRLPGTVFGYKDVKTLFEINSLDSSKINHNIYCNHSLAVYLYTLGAKDIDLGPCKA